MSMSKQDFIALADHVRTELCGFRQVYDELTPDVSIGKVVACLADFCASQNPRFNREQWLDYIAGKCGPSGGMVK